MNEQNPGPRRPDAVLIPMDFPTRRGFRGRRFDFLFDTAEEVLGADPTRGGKAYRRDQVERTAYFFTLDPADTMLFPHDHPRARKPRYHWVEQRDGEHKGCVFGYLTDDAKADMETTKTDA